MWRPRSKRGLVLDKFLDRHVSNVQFSKPSDTNPTSTPPVSSPTGYTPCILPPAPSSPSGLDRCIPPHTTKSLLAPRFRRRFNRFTTFQNLGPDDPIATDADATSDSTHSSFFNRQLHTHAWQHTPTPLLAFTPSKTFQRSNTLNQVRTLVLHSELGCCNLHRNTQRVNLRCAPQISSPLPNASERHTARARI